MRTPSLTLTLPESGAISPVSIFNRVDLPTPLFPTNPNFSPWDIPSEISRNNQRSLNVFDIVSAERKFKALKIKAQIYTKMCYFLLEVKHRILAAFYFHCAKRAGLNNNGDTIIVEKLFYSPFPIERHESERNSAFLLVIFFYRAIVD